MLKKITYFLFFLLILALCLPVLIIAGVLFKFIEGILFIGFGVFLIGLIFYDVFFNENKEDNTLGE